MNRRPGFPVRLASTSPSTPSATRVSFAGRPGFMPDATMSSDAMRSRMVQRLAVQGVSDERVLRAMAAVERHRFVDSALSSQAYEDTSLPIGFGQTISKPNVVGRMIELLLGAPALAHQPHGRLGRVLEIGTGCGYQATLLSHVASEVYSIERVRGMHERARTNMRPFRLATVHLLLGDGMIGYARGAPYAGIIAAASGDAVPEAWIDQLAPGGRIVAPTRAPDGKQVLVVIDRTHLGVRRQALETVHFVPLKSGIA
ncbi:MAG: protein-L-isoaspartate(D-aspartate) O-methyltransferase [Variovorax sp.]|jgi:protein-L-isoaspartate(D-aspartate) O-methyltransferase|nr:MAG: protein-L-isoaspartate(D-aspartate) O-methyltransferase [Variovorax sp.]